MNKMSSPNPLFDLTGKFALITGGARKLGFQMAMALARAGASVAVSSRLESDAVEAARRIHEETDALTFGLTLDIRDLASLQKAEAKLVSEFGSPDILVNNAGGTVGKSPTHLFERDPEDIKNMLELNLLGTIFCTRQFAQAMAKRRQGKIINIASVAAVVGRDRAVYASSGLAAQPVEYAAAKAGLIGFTLDCAALLGPDGIGVNVISPGGFDTPSLPATFRTAYSNRTALGRMGDPAFTDLNGAVTFLASAASNYVTGHNLIVDGGFNFFK